MKKIIFITIMLIFTDMLSAQKLFIPKELPLKISIDIDESGNMDDLQRRRRRSKRGKQAPIAVGGSITTMKLFDADFDDKFRIGMGANAWLNLSQSNALSGGIYYFLPVSQDFLDAKNTNSYFIININFQQFIVGDNKEDFGFYAIGGLGYIINFNNTETPTMDINARYTNININLGVGAQFNLNFGYLFTELQGSLGLMKFEIPADPADGVNVPSYFNFRAGIKIPLKF
jgi:hypothetical protein